MAAKPYRPKMTAAEKKAAKSRDKNFGKTMGRLGGMGGQYGRKAENLTAKQLKASGAAAAAKKRTVSISQTSRDYSRGLTLGPGGKPLTGSVKLQNGKIAVYKGGKRVQATPVKKATPKASTGGGGTSVKKISAVDAAKAKMGKAAGYGKGAGTPSNLTGNSGGAGGPKKNTSPRAMASTYRGQKGRNGAPIGTNPSKPASGGSMIDLPGIGPVSKAKALAILAGIAAAPIPIPLKAGATAAMGYSAARRRTNKKK